MAVYNLTGSGTVALSAGVSRLTVAVTTVDPNHTIGRATPPNYYDLGLLRLGVPGGYGPTRPVDSTAMYLDCPAGVAALGYTLFGSTAITVTEQFAVVANSSLQPWDRNPTPVVVSAGANVSAGQTNIPLWSYTVPAGKLLRVSTLQAETLPYAMGAAANSASSVAININGTEALAAVTPSSNPDSLSTVAAPSDLTLPGGSVIAATASNSATDTIAFCFAALSGYTFNA